MKVTGNIIKQQIQLVQLEVAALWSQFEDSLKKYADETKEDPLIIMSRIEAAEIQIASLQEIQAQFNLIKIAEVDFAGIKLGITLCRAVKTLGGLNRIASKWETLTKPEKNRYHSWTRSKDAEEARDTITKEQALTNLKQAKKLVNSYKAAIAEANAQEHTIDDSYRKLFA